MSSSVATTQYVVRQNRLVHLVGDGLHTALLLAGG
jgi:hypothetical protein